MIDRNTKKCPRCNTVKRRSDFSRNPARGDGISSHCKECRSLMYREQKSKILSKSHEYYIKNSEWIAEKKKIYRKNNPHIAKLWWAANPQKVAEYKERHRPNFKIWAKKHREKYKHDLRRKVNSVISSTIYKNLKQNNGKQGESWTKMLPYSVEQLMRHIEKQFYGGMSWENYGKYGWHIDHKIPRAAFNFRAYTDIDFKKCWALKNLQPMWAHDNHVKRDKLDKPFQPSLTL
jgi:hypothetical protein